MPIKNYISGSRRLSNVFWALSISLGGSGFFFTGLSSYFGINFLPFSDVRDIPFLPQGIVLLFYGTVGLILGLFLCLTLWWDVGFGYNEYNKGLQKVILYRKGFPGQNRELTLTFPTSKVRSIQVQIKDGLNPQRQLFLCLNDGRKIPLIGVGQPIALSTLENNAVNLAKYLNVYLETE